MNEPPRILILIGTRPEAIKLAPVARALRARPEPVELSLISTGQHDDLLESALTSLGLALDENLGIMRPDQDLYDVGIRCLSHLRDCVQARRPHVIVVQGDTATVFFGALVAYYERCEVGHVEAGLRSRHKWAPYPEEMYRRLTDVLADYFFAPTGGARDNLLAEGIAADRVNVTGNTVIDAVQAMIEAGAQVSDPELAEVLRSERRLVLVTAHRRESFGAPIREAFGALGTLAESHPDHVFVYPVHPNPNVKGPAEEILGPVRNFHLLEPLSYADLVQALSRAYLVVTDSGGIQEEAPSFGVPVLVMREVTERPEGVASGVVELVGTSRERILARAGQLLDDEAEHGRMARARNPYGDGRAGERIADILLHRLLDVPRQTEDWA